MDLCLLPLSKILLAFVLEGSLVELKLLPDELASQWVEFDVDFELFHFILVACGQNAVNGMLAVRLIQPLVLGYLIVVHLLVKYVLLASGLVPLDENVLVLDGLGPFDGCVLLLLGGEGGEEVGGVVQEEALGPGDEGAAVEAVALALHGADNFPAVEAVVDEVVLLGHAGALGPLQVDFLGPLLVLLAHVKELFTNK